MNIKGKEILSILGKRLVGVLITSEKGGGGPVSQLFLVFDDQTYFELYSDGQIRTTSKLYEGDIHYLHDLVKRDFTIIFEMSLDENMELHFMDNQ
jgi:hypothetical protein